MRYLKWVMIFLFFSIFLGGCHKKIDYPIRMSFLSCQDADITFIQDGDISILIDTGENTCKEKVLSFLEKQQISNINVLILSHPDKDHIGNAVDIMKTVKVDKVYMSGYKKNSELEDELLEYLKENQLDYKVVSEKTEFQLGNMDILIEPPKKLYDSSNNSSLITYVKIGDIRTFFGADIKNKRIAEMTALKSEIVKLPYHGRYLSNLEALLENLKPEYVIITSENPDERTISLLEKMNIKYEVTKQDIVIEMDGTSWRRGK